MKYLALLVSFLCVACNGGYYGPPLPGVNLKGKLPEAFSRFSTADKFAAEIALRSSYIVVSSHQTTTEQESLSYRMVCLADPQVRDRTIFVSVYASMKEINIEINTKQRDDEIAKLANDIYSAWFPDSVLEPYLRRRGILGP